MLKLIEQKVGKSIKHMGTGGNFLNRTPIAYSLRSRINKCGLIKLQSFCKAKDTVNKTKRPPTALLLVVRFYVEAKQCKLFLSP